MTLPTVEATPVAPDATAATLSTGRRVSLPLSASASVVGATLAVPVEGLRSAVPWGLSPVSLWPGTGAVTLAALAYHRVGDLDPYREFAVIVPVREDRRRLPGLGGYVAYLPVTSAESVALGREVWGYPKERVSIDVAGGGRCRRATVQRDGDVVVELSVSRPRATVPAAGTLSSYTAPDGGVYRTPVGLRGRVSVGLGGGVALSVGSGPRADGLRSLGLDADCRCLARFVTPDLSARLSPGRRIGEDSR